MKIPIDKGNVRWWDAVLASFIFFTRLPLWRLRQPSKECYTRVVEYWPLTGWLTGTVTGATLYVASMFFPSPLPVILALAARLLLTGAFHEDGLCDFFDGFGGGGSNRERILAIMKDSRVGTYGVLGMLIYVLLFIGALSPLPPLAAALTIATADPFAKMISSQLIMMMPYARKEEEAKAKVVYRRMDIRASLLLALQGLLPLIAYVYFVLVPANVRWDMPVFVPCLTMYFLYLLVWRRLRGYTGDCCGAVYLLVELSFLLTISACF